VIACFTVLTLVWLPSERRVRAALAQYESDKA